MISRAQDLRPADLRFEHLTVDQGLAHSDAKAVTQDRAGFIWVGTVWGIDRYDGYQLQHYKLPANKLTLDATLWVEKGQPYMVYCFEWLQNMNGTVEKIALKPDLSGTTGPAQVLFQASDSPWSREKTADGHRSPNRITDGPWVFRTQTGRLGMLWTSWVYDVYTQGVAYSTSGTLAGSWVQEPAPITPPSYGHGMLFRTLEGKLLLAIHSHKEVNGRYLRVPHLFEADLSGDALVIDKPYQP